MRNMPSGDRKTGMSGEEQSVKRDESCTATTKTLPAPFDFEVWLVRVVAASQTRHMHKKALVNRRDTISSFT